MAGKEEAVLTVKEFEAIMKKANNPIEVIADIKEILIPEED